MPAVAKQLADEAADLCTTTPPTFGAGSADQIGGGASSQSRALVRDLMGPNLQQLVVDEDLYGDKEGAACQPAAVGAEGKLYDALWEELRRVAKDALAGKHGPAVTSGAELETAIVKGLGADAKYAIAKRTGQLVAGITDTCGATAKPLVQMFHGACVPSSSTTAADLAACAASSTRCLQGADLLASIAEQHKIETVRALAKFALGTAPNPRIGPPSSESRSRES